MAAGDGLVTMTPTSIVVAGAGSSASINSDGGVDFTSATSLSLNGVFTSLFDNYLIVVGAKSSVDDINLSMKLRLSGTDTSANYAYQQVAGNGSFTAGFRATSVASWVSAMSAGLTNGVYTIAVYGPFLAQPTAVRSVVASSYANAYLRDMAGTHSNSTSYDGFTLIPSSGAVTGVISVFGYEE